MTDTQIDETPWVDENTLATVDRWLAYQVWAGRVPGAQVAVGRRGTVLFSRAYGWADVEGRISMGSQHLFRIASHSKTFTATLVLRLVERGRLGLEDALGEHLDELAGTEVGEVSIRELLEHTGGILRDGADADFWAAGRTFPDAAELRTLVGTRGKRAPGELFAYSNLGYALLGAVIEKVTGQPYAEVVAEQITGPLGLSDTTADYRPERADDYAVGYLGLHVAVRRESLRHVDTRAYDPAAGVTSNAGDLVAYFGAHALGDDRLLTDRSKRRMQRRANATDPDKEDGPTYGLGMDGDTIGERRVVGHGGGYPGHITHTLLDPTDGLVVTALTNAIDGPARTLAVGMLKIIDDALAHPGEPVAAEVLAHTGRWAGDWGPVDLAVVGGRILGLQPASADPVESVDVLEVEAPDRWRIARGNGYGSVGETVIFTADGAMRYGGISMRRFDELPERDPR